VKGDVAGLAGCQRQNLYATCTDCKTHPYGRRTAYCAAARLSSASRIDKANGRHTTPTSRSASCLRGAAEHPATGVPSRRRSSIKRTLTLRTLQHIAARMNGVTSYQSRWCAYRLARTGDGKAAPEDLCSERAASLGKRMVARASRATFSPPHIWRRLHRHRGAENVKVICRCRIALCRRLNILLRQWTLERRGGRRYTCRLPPTYLTRRASNGDMTRRTGWRDWRATASFPALAARAGTAGEAPRLRHLSYISSSCAHMLAARCTHACAGGRYTRKKKSMALRMLYRHRTSLAHDTAHAAKFA